MRKFLFSLLALLAVFTACKQDIPVFDTYYVKNSAWETVEKRSVERALQALTLEEYVAKYNAETTDDQLFIMETDVPIEEAPEAMAFICTRDTHEIITAYTGIPRAQLVEDREAFRLQTYAMAGVLFIDRIPKPNPPVIPPPDFERYAVYLVDPTDAIIYETHCETWEADGYTSMEAMFLERRNACTTQAYGNGAGWRCVAGRLFPDPPIVPVE